ncbi:MAG TPA: SDR family oxidoreductase [Planctomycetota bacterium]|jgi:NAD(P)-dependent dehydrogenase (short-subunit alcohol dehydrogenase family)
MNKSPHLKHAVVMGGARGIGEAIVRRLAAGGYAVTIADRLKAQAVSLSKELNKNCLVTFAAGVDITQARDLRALASAVKKRAGNGGLHVAVNTAGIFHERRTLLQTPIESFERLIDVNLLGAFRFSQAIAPLMAPGGSIIHTGSINGVLAAPELGAYKITKAALHMLVRCLALELARDPRRIRVNAVAPGWVDTPGERTLYKAGKGKPHPLDDPETARWIPLGRRNQPHEVADAVAFLCSDQAISITGHILPVDGGVLAR